MISVVVPMYNVEEYIDETINSLLNQTYDDIEILLVDDASTDNTVEICKKYYDKRIRIIELNDNHGQVYAYLKGISLSNGEYLAFVDSDDFVDSRMFEIMLEKMNQTEADIVACGCYHVYGKEKIVEPRNICDLDGFELVHDEICKSFYDLHSKNNPIDTIIKLYRWNKLYKKSIVENNLKYCQPEIRVFEDNNFVIPCLLDCNKVSYINKPLYFYRRRKASTMTMFDKSILESNRLFLINQNKIFCEKGISHRMATDAYVTSMFSVQRVFHSKSSLIEKIRFLDYIREDVIKYNVTSGVAKYCGASKKLRLMLICLRLRLFFIVVLLGEMNLLINRTLERG